MCQLCSDFVPSMFGLFRQCQAAGDASGEGARGSTDAASTPAPAAAKAAAGASEVVFQVGDQVRTKFGQNKEKYDNVLGEVTKVLSMHCWADLENPWGLHA